jgi:hypothetical protein
MQGNRCVQQPCFYPTNAYQTAKQIDHDKARSFMRPRALPAA